RSAPRRPSADGRYVAFVSLADNLVTGDTNGADDVFVHDRITGETTRVNVASDGSQADGSSFDSFSSPVLSADGRVVAFVSLADNLVPGDTNQVSDVFVHDRATGETTRVSVASDGSQALFASFFPALSADGSLVAFASAPDGLVPGDTSNLDHVFVHDCTSRQTTQIDVGFDRSPSNGLSWAPQLSADGSLVVFVSEASNLVMNDTNGVADVFVHDRTTHTTTRVSIDSHGAQANGGFFFDFPAISPKGRYVAFGSGADNLVTNDTNGLPDGFVHDLTTHTTTRLSVDSHGGQGDRSPRRLVSPPAPSDGRPPP